MNKTKNNYMPFTINNIQQNIISKLSDQLLLTSRFNNQLIKKMFANRYINVRSTTQIVYKRHIEINEKNSKDKINT